MGHKCIFESGNGGKNAGDIFLAAAAECDDVAEYASQRWLNLNLPVARNPKNRTNLVTAARKLLARNIKTNTKGFYRLYWIIVQDLIDKMQYKAALKELDKALS